MTVLVLGATGFIGPHVVQHLLKGGHDIVAFHRGETHAPFPEGVSSMHGDRNALDEHQAAFDALAPDVVVDVIPYTKAQAQQAVDVFGGLANRLVAVSSSDVYRNYDGWRGASASPPDPVPLTEDAPLRDDLYPYRGYEGLDFEYAETYDKILVERVVMDAGDIEGTVLRLPAVYGPGNAQHRLASHLQRMDDGRPAILLDESHAQWRWTHGYVENVGAAIARAAAHPKAAGRVFNVGEAEPPTAAERIRALGDAVGWSGAVCPVPAENLPESLTVPGDWRYELATDTRQIRDVLGHQAPVSFAEALRRTAAWERTQRSDDRAPPKYDAEDAVLQRYRPS